LRLLVDTHVLLWGINEPERVPRDVAAAMASRDNQTYVSVVCLWEIAIKKRLGKLTAPDNLPEVVERHPDFRVLPISAAHAWRVRTLPMLHGDPFDHLLIAQALVEDMTVVTHDRVLRRYGVSTISV
jgi:PIN domain nuclease of toxin-antitoxin system